MRRIFRVTENRITNLWLGRVPSTHFHPLGPRRQSVGSELGQEFLLLSPDNLFSDQRSQNAQRGKTAAGKTHNSTRSVINILICNINAARFKPTFSSSWIIKCFWSVWLEHLVRFIPGWFLSQIGLKKQNGVNYYYSTINFFIDGY